MSSFTGLYTGLSGIQASQRGLDITSHNVANANTPGYTRQRVELAARPAYQSVNGQVGTGVDVQSIARLRDNFLDDRFRAAVGDRGQQSVRAEVLAGLESLAGEPDQGISVRIERLWAAAETWANDPSDAAARQQVLTELTSITEGFRATSASWDRLADDLTDRLSTEIATVNRTLESLDDLDRQITNTEPGRIGPDLFDQRDVLLDQLAGLTGATSKIQTDGSVQVTLDGQDLLTSTGPAVLSLNGSGFELDGVAVANLGGELGGLRSAIQDDIPSWRNQLDVLARGMADAINDVNSSGGGPGLLGFADPGDPAGTFVTLTTDIADLAASTLGAGAGPHDGSNARAMADLRTEAVSFPGGDRTIENQHADLVVGLAGAVRSSRASADAAGGVATGAQLARAAEHGVSLDEEMVGLVRYQRALEASARVMTTVDQALDVLVNRVGIVGR